LEVTIENSAVYPAGIAASAFQVLGDTTVINTPVVFAIRILSHIPELINVRVCTVAEREFNQGCIKITAVEAGLVSGRIN
jgi:hypothetical protein